MADFFSRVFQAGRRFVAERRQAAERRRELRDQSCWNNFEAAQHHALVHSHRIGIVTEIRQNASTGTKGWMQWIVSPDGQLSRDSVWVRNMRLQTGSMLVVSGSYGYGEHHNETVFYIDRVEGQLDRRDYDGWLRQEARRNRS
jgi:hypothetical protein